MDVLFVLYVTDFSGAVLHFVFVKQPVDQAPQADTESRFKEKEQEAYKAGETGENAVRVQDDHEKEHDTGKGNADLPGKLLLGCANIFRVLTTDNETTDNEHGSKPRIDEYPDNHVGEEKNNDVFNHQEVALEDDHYQRNKHEDEQDPGRGAYLSFVENGNIETFNGFSELK